MFGQKHQDPPTDERNMDQSVVAAASSYEETPGGAPMSSPSVISPTTPPPPPPPPLSSDATSTAPSLSLPSIQQAAPVTASQVEAESAPAAETASTNTAPAVPLETVEATGSASVGTSSSTTTTTTTPAASEVSYPEPATSSSQAKTAPEGMEDLFLIKQDALHDLSPLVSHLDQSPEDRFRTLMMMIQASDDQELIRPAYDAAHQITDEKVRAQALLDIVNEINYFTQHQASAQ